MSDGIPGSYLQLRSLVKNNAELELSLAQTDMPQLGCNDVLLRIEAAPLNPSDLGLLFGAADMAKAVYSGTPQRPLVSAPIAEQRMASMKGRLGVSMAVGNEGAGVVVAAGSSASAQALLGKTVAVLRGAMYSQYQAVPADQCLQLPDDASAADGASAFVNPLTALGMVETMKREGHTALVHTAAASSLGQILNRVCIKDGIALVNIVRKPEQAALLRSQGARHVCDSSAPTFTDELTEALSATGATIAFDAIGGGKLAGQILGCMEAAQSRTASEYSRYGSTVHKQVYLYGVLDNSPTELVRNFGFAWGMGGWLLFPFLQKIGPHARQVLEMRVLTELKTTFVSHYARELSLAEVLQKTAVSEYGLRATGKKFLVNPNKSS